MKRGLCTLAIIASMVGAVGCASTAHDGDSAAVSREAPRYADIRAAYNTRVKRLERVWARVSLRLRGVDDQKQPFDEVVDGNLQLEQPRNFSLLVVKLGSTYFDLGSNSTQFWWLDLYNKPYSALVGDHATARAEDTAKFGLPVYPLDLMPLLGITPLPEGEPKSLTMDASGRVVVVLPGRTGDLRLVLDRATMRPVTVELLDQAGSVLVSAAHSEYIAVEVRGDPSAQAAIASRIALNFKHADLQADVSIWDPENKPVRAELFNLASMKDRYGVERETRIGTNKDGRTNP